MRTRRFLGIGSAVMLVVSLSLSPVALAVEPAAEGATQGELSSSWSPLAFFLHIWKSVIHGGNTIPVATDENGLTQASEGKDPDIGPSIEPNGRSL